MVGQSAKKDQGRYDDGATADAEPTRGEAGQKADSGVKKGLAHHRWHFFPAQRPWQAGFRWFRRLAKGERLPLPHPSMLKRSVTILSVLMAVVLAGCAVKDPTNPRFVVAEGRGI